MSLGYDGSIRIKADLNHSDFDRGLSAMTGSIKKFSGTLMKIAGAVGLAFSVAALVNFGKEAVNAASALNDAWIGLQSIVEGQGKSFSKAKSFINDYISDGLVPLENAVTAYKNLAARGYSSEQIEKVMTALKDAAAFGRQSSYTLGEAVATATEGLKNENSILVDNAGVTKNVAKMWQDYADELGISYTALTQEQKIQAEVNGILEETRFQTGDAAKLVNTYSGQVAMLSYNFQQFKVAVGNAIMPVVQAVLPGINAIIAALTKLATVFAQVTALLFGKSAQLTATDGIASSAGSAADATDDLADATDAAGDASESAAKKMKGVLAGFDELNILADNAASSTSGAADGLDVGAIEIPSYDAEIKETDQLSDSFEHLGEVFVKALDDMLAAIPALREALLGFAGNFNEFNQKVYDGFTFDGVKERVQTLGTELAVAFNDLVTAIDWELWGRKLGAGLNLGLNFLTSFIYEFDWKALGSGLAEWINGLVYEIDWYEFGRLLWAKFKIALETLAGFIIGLDMPALAEAASNIIKGFFDSMKDTLERIDWKEIGKQIAEFLNNIDWIGIITSIAGALKEMVGAAIDLIGGFIENADPETLLVAFAFLAAKIAPKIASIIASKIGEKLKTSLAEILSNIDLSKIIKPALGSLSIGVGLTIMFEDITSILSGEYKNVSWLSLIKTAFSGVALGAGVAALVGTPIGWTIAIALGLAMTIKDIVVNWDDIKSMCSDITDGIAALFSGDVDTFWGKISDAFLTWKGLDALGPKVSSVISQAMFGTDFIGGIREYFQNSETLEAAFEPIYDALVKPFVDAWEDTKKEWDTAGEWFNTNVVEPVAGFFDGLGGGIKTALSDTWNDVQNKWNGAGEWFDTTVVGPVQELFSGMWENVGTSTSDAWQGVQDVWGVVSGWFDENIIQPIAEFFTGLWECAGQLASDAWDEIVGVWESVSDWFDTNVIQPVSQFFSGLFDGIWQTASNIWSDIQELWGDASQWFEEHVTGPIGEAFNAACEVAKGAINGAISAVEGMINAVIKAVNWLISQLNKVKFDIPDWVPAVGGKSFGFNIPPISEVTLPRLANGAVIPPNQQFAAILGDQRSGTNIEAPLKTIEQALRNVMGESGFGSDVVINLTAELDGKVLTKKVIRVANAMTRSSGKPVFNT